MVRRLIEWAVGNPLIVVLLALALAAVGGYAFLNVNVEAYPDPAPAIIEVVAQYPGASAEEVERQVTIPLESTLTGMKGLKFTRSKSLFGLAHLRNQFAYGVDYYAALQQVINRLQFSEPLPAGVSPQISPVTPTGELMRYTLTNPAPDQPAYTLNDLKEVEDWVLERQFKRVPGVIDVTSFGGTVKRYEIHPDPYRLWHYGITLQQLADAVARSNATAGGEHLNQGDTIQNVRGVSLIGGGKDPMQAKGVLGGEPAALKAWVAAGSRAEKAQRGRLADAYAGKKVEPPLTAEERQRLGELRQQLGRTAAQAAGAYLRSEEEERLRAIRQIPILSVNNRPVLVDHLVEGGPLDSSGVEAGRQGVVVGHQTRLGRVSLSRRRPDAHGNPAWVDEEEKVMGVVLMRKGEETIPTLKGVKDKLDELNTHPGRLLPGVQLEPHFDLTGLIHLTTETVRENLLVGMALVTVVLLMFLSNVRTALIVAVNIPLALLFAFTVLFLRGKSANLLSIGAVDFGIIIDSSVIMVENVYRHVSSGDYPELRLRDRIIRASHEVERSLFFSTAIMVCAFIPLFTLQGPEGQIFGPMADTYAFALGGALLLALTLSPVLCLLLFKHLRPARDNFLVRWLRAAYLWQLERCLDHRWLTLAVVGALLVVTGAALPFLGQEFMPELEEGNLYIRGTFPVSISLEEAAEKARKARAIMRTYPEVDLIQSQVGRPDDGTDPTGFYNVEFSVPLRPEKEWPAVKEQAGWKARLFGAKRPRTKPELVEEMKGELNDKLIGVDWNFSQYIRDNVMESLSGVKGDNSVKIIGPDLDELEKLADRVKSRLEWKGDKYQGPEPGVRGVEDVTVFRIKGQPNLEFHADTKKCQRFGVRVDDVNNVIQTAVGGQPFTRIVEGEKRFDLTLRWAEHRRDSERAILGIPVAVTNNTVTAGAPGVAAARFSGAAMGLSPYGFSFTLPSLYGSVYAGTLNDVTTTPWQPLKNLVTPVDDDGKPDPDGQFTRAGASTIYREQGNRLIAVGFSVRGRDLAGAVAEAQRVTADLFQAPYRAEWSGEFEEMQDANRRLVGVGAVSLLLIFVLLYLAFRSLLDAIVVFSNVVAVSMGGVWALLLTGTNFNVSAAVGFISILGVAIMNGLLMVSSFNALRARGVEMREAILTGVGKLVRPVTMTALAAIFGLLPAALSTRIGSQSQRPLAIAVVGGMMMTLVLRNLVPFLYSFYGRREPRPEAGRMAH